jgi:hypothetical protein
LLHISGTNDNFFSANQDYRFDIFRFLQRKNSEIVFIKDS